MPELTNEERLQPSLLDRLTDNEPKKSVESHRNRVLTAPQLRESVVRDLAWLLNTQNLKGSPEMRGDAEMKGCQNMDGCKLAEQSVINYGIPPLSGLTASGINLKHLINSLTEAIRNFEPRLIRDTIQVTAQRKKSRDNPNTLDFVIEAQLWSQPLPIHLMLVTSVDLETGHIEVSEKDDE